MVKIKCVVCGEVFEAENIEDAVCPVCGLSGDSLVLAEDE